MVKIATNKINNWIFVTGLIRSGTTFVGTTLSIPKEVDYIHEPFNPQCGIPGINQWYPYIQPDLPTEDMNQYHEKVKKIFTYNFELKNHIPKEDPWVRRNIKRIIGSRGPFNLRLAKINPFHKNAIIKDPTGVLLTEYLYINFKVKPVIIIKHPTSFIASLKRVGWWKTPHEISNLSCLTENYFSDFLDIFEKTHSNPIVESTKYWCVVHKTLLEQARKYPDWQVIKHEELSKDPVQIFKALYTKLDLPWSKAIEKKIVTQTQGNRSAKAQKGRVQDFRRNSADIFKASQQSLTIEERQKIFEVFQSMTPDIYHRDSFAID